MHRAGADYRHPDIMLTQFLSDRITEAIQSPLRGGVGGAVGQSVFPSERRNVDDVSRACTDHQGRERADGEVDAAKVRVQDAVPFLGRQVMKERIEAADSGVVDENVDACKSALHPSGGVLDLVQNGDVAGNNLGLSSSFCDGERGLVQSGLSASTEYGGSTQSGELAGNGGANAASGPGNDSDLTM